MALNIVFIQATTGKIFDIMLHKSKNVWNGQKNVMTSDVLDINIFKVIEKLSNHANIYPQCFFLYENYASF